MKGESITSPPVAIPADKHERTRARKDTIDTEVCNAGRTPGYTAAII